VSPPRPRVLPSGPLESSSTDHGHDTPRWYGPDLAYIHDAGFGDYALGSAPGILGILRDSGISEGLAVDLGCGSGLWARALTDAGYRVLGIDISEEMIALARRRVPEAEFRVSSLFESDILPCKAVTAIGECFNYTFGPQAGGERLHRLFRRVYEALVPGGAFIFDVAEPGQVRSREPVRSFSTGEDWAVLVEKQEDTEHKTLTRRIVSFRKAGEHYRRSQETHLLRLYRSAEISAGLRRVGFRVRTRRGYGRYLLPKAHAAFVARRPM